MLGDVLEEQTPMGAYKGAQDWTQRDEKAEHDTGRAWPKSGDTRTPCSVNGTMANRFAALVTPWQCQTRSDFSNHSRMTSNYTSSSSYGEDTLFILQSCLRTNSLCPRGTRHCHGHYYSRLRRPLVAAPRCRRYRYRRCRYHLRHYCHRR